MLLLSLYVPHILKRWGEALALGGDASASEAPLAADCLCCVGCVSSCVKERGWLGSLGEELTPFGGHRG